jgi:hypothetical protein
MLLVIQRRGDKADATRTIPILDRDDSVDAVDVADAIDREIETVWGVIAALQCILAEHGDEPYINGALCLAKQPSRRIVRNQARCG